MATGSDHDSGTMQRYLTDVRACRRLDRDEERLQARRMRRGDPSAVRRLVESNLGFVVKIAFEYRHLGLPLGDLINEGNLGLLRATEKFDPDRGVKFISYAVWWIRKAMLKAIASQSQAVRIPMSRLRQLWSAPGGGRLGPVQVPFDNVNGHGEIERTAAVETTEERMLREERRRNVTEALAALDSRQRYVIEHRFGLGGVRRRTLRELASELEVSTEWVRRLELKAKDRLRSLLRTRSGCAGARPGRPTRVH